MRASGNTRVPLAIRWGGKLQTGSKSDDFVSLTDFKEDT